MKLDNFSEVNLYENGILRKKMKNKLLIVEVENYLERNVSNVRNGLAPAVAFSLMHIISHVSQSVSQAFNSPPPTSNDQLVQFAWWWR